MVKSTEEQQKKADLLIMPKLKNMGSLDFSNIDTLIALGEKAARNMLPQIRALKKELNLKNQSPTKIARNFTIPTELNITSIDFSDGFGTPTQLFIKNNHVIRVLPGYDKITHKTN